MVDETKKTENLGKGVEVQKMLIEIKEGMKAPTEVGDEVVDLANLDDDF